MGCCDTNDKKTRETRISKLGRVCQAGARINPISLLAPTSQNILSGPFGSKALPIPEVIDKDAFKHRCIGRLGMQDLEDLVVRR